VYAQLALVVFQMSLSMDNFIARAEWRVSSTWVVLLLDTLIMVIGCAVFVFLVAVTRYLDLEYWMNDALRFLGWLILWQTLFSEYERTEFHYHRASLAYLVKWFVNFACIVTILDCMALLWYNRLTLVRPFSSANECMDLGSDSGIQFSHATTSFIFGRISRNLFLFGDRRMLQSSRGIPYFD